MKSRSWLIVFAFFVLAGALSLNLSNIQVSMDISEQKDLNLLSLQHLEDINRSFGHSDDFTFFVDLKKSLSKTEQCDFYNVLKRFNNNHQSVNYILHPWNERGMVSQPGFLAFPPLIIDPCGTDEPWFQSKIKPLFKYNWSSLDGERVKFSMGLNVASENSTVSLVSHVNDLTDDIKKQFAEAQVQVVGPSAFRYHLFMTTVKDAWVSALAIFVTLCLVYLYFNSLVICFYLLVSLLMSLFILFGVASFTDLKIDFLINGLVLILITSIISDFTFIFDEAKKTGFKRAFKKVRSPSFITSLTTILGFLSLLTSDLSTVRNFGLLAAMGALIEWIISFVFLPHLVAVTPERFVFKEKMGRLYGLMSRLAGVSFPKWLVYPLIAISLSGVVGLFHLNYYDSPLENFPKNHILRKIFEKKENSNLPRTILKVKVPAEEVSVLEQELSSKLGENKDILEVQTFENLLAEDYQRQSAMRKNLILRELSLSPLYKSFQSNHEDQKWLVFIKNYSLDSLTEIRKTILEICPNCSVGGTALTYAETSLLVAESLLISFVMSIFLILFVIFYFLRRKLKTVFVPAFLSILFGPLFLTSVMALFQIPVNIITCILFAVIVGITGDNFIQYFFDDKELKKGIDNKSIPSLFISFCLIGTSLVFTLQTLVPLKTLGFLFTLGFFVNFVGDYFILKKLDR